MNKILHEQLNFSWSLWWWNSVKKNNAKIKYMVLEGSDKSKMNKKKYYIKIYINNLIQIISVSHLQMGERDSVAPILA